jgi:hypothetical protein
MRSRGGVRRQVGRALPFTRGHNSDTEARTREILRDQASFAEQAYLLRMLVLERSLVSGGSTLEDPEEILGKQMGL